MCVHFGRPRDTYTLTHQIKASPPTLSFALISISLPFNLVASCAINHIEQHHTVHEDYLRLSTLCISHRRLRGPPTAMPRKACWRATAYFCHIIGISLIQRTAVERLMTENRDPAGPCGCMPGGLCLAHTSEDRRRSCHRRLAALPAFSFRADSLDNVDPICTDLVRVAWTLPCSSSTSVS